MTEQLVYLDHAATTPMRQVAVDAMLPLLAEAGYFLLLSVAVLLVGVGLLAGRRWARGPAIVVQLLLLGVAWYTAVPSGRPEFGVPVALVCLAVFGLLLGQRARSWFDAGRAG